MARSLRIEAEDLEDLEDFKDFKDFEDLGVKRVPMLVDLAADATRRVPNAMLNAMSHSQIQ